MFGDSTSGQRVLYQLGMTQIPIINVNNNCSTGSTALYLARAAVASGTAECVLALGFERMKRGFITEAFPDRTNPLGNNNNAHFCCFHPSELTVVQIMYRA